MKKEEKLTPTTTKPLSLYRYELKATNQILKDTMNICQSSLQSTAHTNRNNYTPLQELDDYLFDDHYFPTHPTPNSQHAYTQKPKKQHPSNQFSRSHLQKKLFQEFQLQKNSFHKQLQSKIKHQQIKKEEQVDRQAFISSQIYSFSSQNQNYPSKKSINRHQCFGQTSLRNNASYDNRIQPRRQRRGLANISLKVKNIVAKIGKMTFKQVSEQVLRESEQYLPSEPIARQKEMKNIRRRVYDALNVLVSVGILGKYQRCVVQTEFTKVPGKKLSEHWEIITQKNRILQEQQINYNNKLNNLTMLKKHYQMVLLFHQRNRKLNESSEKREQNTRNQQKQHIITSQGQSRFYFPLVLIVPPKIQINNIKVNIQYDEKYPQSIKKFIIEDIQDVFTDLNVLKYLNLHQQIKDDTLSKLKKEMALKHSKRLIAAEYQKIQYFHKDPTLQPCDDIYLSD